MVVLMVHFYIFHPGSGWTAATPLDHLFDIHGVAFEDRLDPAVAGVAHSYRNRVPPSCLAGFRAKENALHPAADHDVVSGFVHWD